MSQQWHKPEVDRHSVWTSYVDEFPQGHAFGVLQENGQNSFDAYVDGTTPATMRVTVRYDADARVLTWQDFGTTGMHHCRGCTWGEQPSGARCTNRDCPWGAFHNMGYSAKGGMSLGSRGMGKALQLLAGDRTVVRTMLPDGRRAASEWRHPPDKDWEWRLAPDLAVPLDAPGVQIETHGVIDAVHTTLIDVDAVLTEMQERWFRLIEDGATIEYALVRNGRATTHKVKAPPQPALDESRGRSAAKQEHSRVIVHYHEKRLGELRNVKLYLAKTPFADGDPRCGIAIVKNGKQTVSRFRDFPSEVPDEIRRRIFGHCDAICTDAEPFLKNAENATHTNYRPNDDTFRAVRRELRKLIKAFAEPFMRSGSEKITERESKEAQEILTVLNRALEQIPDLNLFGKGVPEEPEKEPPKDHVYISRIEFENRSYKRGEVVAVRVILRNPTSVEQLVRVVVEHSDPTPVTVASFEDAAILPPASTDGPATGLLEWPCQIDPALAPGIHAIHGSLRRVDKEPIRDGGGKPVAKKHWLYVETEPPEITRTRSTKKGDQPDAPRSGFNNLQYFRKPDLAETYEAFIDASQGAAFVNIAGRRLDYFRRNAKSKRSFWPVVGEVVGEKLVEYLLETKLSERETWTTEEVRSIVQGLENNRTKLVRVMIKIVGTEPQPHDAVQQPQPHVENRPDTGEPSRQEA